MASNQITLELLLDGFTKLKNVYSALKEFSKIQDDLLRYEKTKSSEMKAEIKKLTSLEEQHKGIIEELLKEKEALNTALVESQRECDRLRKVYIDRNVENDEIYRLQNELKVVKAKLALQEEKHAEEISKRERQYTEELQKYQIMLESRYQLKSTKTLKHPAMDDSPDKRLVNVKPKKITLKEKQSLRWPELDILKTTQPVVKNIKNEYDIDNDKSKIIRKKKKLYCEDKEMTVDV